MKNSRKPNPQKRQMQAKKLRISLLLIVFVFIALGVQLFRIMIIQGKDLGSKSENQFLNQKKVMPKRGSILDRNGRELAVSADVYKVSLDLEALDNYSEAVEQSKSNTSNRSKNSIKIDIANKIASALEIESKKVEEVLDDTDGNGNLLRGVSIARKVDKYKIDKLKEIRKQEKYNFMIIENDTVRYYPNNNFLAHTIGSVDIDGKGLLGLELYYDDELTGIPGMRIAEVDRNSLELPYDDPVYTEPVNGKNITLTIDENIQYIAEQVAQKTLEENKAKGVTIVVTNPKSGEILAMVNKPDFNPNDPRKGISKSDELLKLWRNNAVNDVFEPGSTFKIVTTAAALEEKLTFLDDAFYCKGYSVVNGVTIGCWEKGGHGAENLLGILKNSCNPGFIELGKRLGQEKINKYIYDFGFGKPTGIDFPGEAAGIVKPTDKMSLVDLATISFGQSDAATAVQLIAAFNSVLNNGVYTTPHLMKEIFTQDKSGTKKVDKTFVEKNSRQVISKKTANELAGYLEKVVSEGSGKKAYIEGYGIAGKTGTAEKASTSGKGYADRKYVASFIGGAPYDDPKVSLFISIDEPTAGEYFGGLIAGPPARDLFEQIFNQLAIRGIQ